MCNSLGEITTSDTRHKSNKERTRMSPAGEVQSSVLSTTDLDTPEYRWVRLRKILWQVGPQRLRPFPRR